MKTPIAVLLRQKKAEVVTVSATVNVADAVRVMNEHRIGSVVVMSGPLIEGIFTERDVLARVVAAGRNPYVTPVRDVMTSNIITVPPTTLVEQVMDIFTNRRCRHLPVIDDGELVGLISIGDISRWLVESHRAEAEHLRAYIAGDLVH